VVTVVNTDGVDVVVMIGASGDFVVAMVVVGIMKTGLAVVTMKETKFVVSL